MPKARKPYRGSLRKRRVSTSGKPFRLFWVAGKYDIALQNSHATVAVLKDAGIHVEEHESGGFHAYPNWRDYLHQFAQLVFKSPEAHLSASSIAAAPSEWVSVICNFLSVEP